MIFLQIILPVLLIFFAGFGLQRTFRLDLKPISTLAIYVLTPSLVFRTFYKAEIDIQLFYIVATTSLLLIALIATTWLTSRLLHYDKRQESAMMLITAFMNSGNYGAPIVLFAYGEKGFQYAISIMVLNSITMSVFGVYFASRGQGSAQMALRNVVRMPGNYALVLALLLQYWQVEIPHNFYQSLDMVGDAAIPIVMIILGMQLANVTTNHFEWKGISIASLIRLIVSPLIAYVICLFFALDPILEKVLIVLAAMPTAATTTMYAIQFNTNPHFVSSSALITTLLSFGTIAGLLYVLQ